MDKQTPQKLLNISRGMPARIADRLIKTEVDHTEEEMARMALRSRNISQEKKRAIEISLERGDFKREEQVLDEKVAKEADEYNRIKVRRAIANGQLPDPKNDKFMQDRMKRLAARK